MGLFAGKGKTLYFPGCFASAKLPHVMAATKNVLRDFGIEYVMLDFCCGYPLWYAGYEKEMHRVIEANKELLKKEGITRVITNDPHCALTFKEKYDVEAMHIVEVYKEHLHKIKKGEEQRVDYHHPCFMEKLGISAKVVHGVLRRAGIHINPSVQKCCGSVGQDFERNNKEEAQALAKQRAKDFKETVVTCCPHCHVMLQSQKKKVLDVAELLGEGI